MNVENNVFSYRKEKKEKSKSEEEKDLSDTIPIRERKKKRKEEVYPFFGTLDLETYKNADGVDKVYSIGFYTKRYGVEMLYIDEIDRDSNKLILNCLEMLLVSKYKNYTFYVHNLGGFDIIFLLKPLIECDLYKIKVNSKDGKILSVSIAYKQNIIKLVDSYNILNYSLKDLCKTYNTDISKDIFPYKFVSDDTLFRIGTKPELKYYNNIKASEYKAIPKNWDTKIETLKYLEKDLISLFEVINKFSSRLYLDHQIQVTDSLTISGIALRIYLSKFYNDNIPLIVNKTLYKDVKQSYFGGITEVYKPYGENLYYYDVNSLYPYAALNVMPGLSCTFETFIDSVVNIKDLFGFYFCTVSCNIDNYLGLLPVRNASGIIMPNGSWTGWYFSEELKFAQENGYNIEIHKGYHFNKAIGVFDSYIKYFYNIKSTTKDIVEKAISKSLLNNLLGRFGLDLNKSTTDLVDDRKFNELLQTKVINNNIEISGKNLVTYSNIVNKTLCDELDVDFKAVALLNMKKGISEKSMKDVSVVIPSAITSYARIFMGKVKLNILAQGGKLYYTDTDSIVTDIPLDEQLVNDKLGSFKLEHLIKKGYFISKTITIYDLKEISENKHLVTFDKNVSPIICKEFGLNYIEVINNTNVDYKSLVVVNDSNNVNISISAAITSANDLNVIKK